ncbi:tetratricopeptide repeat protein [Trichocoleus sp. FACHB-591]|uniref:tetratricopeptide repeat protein n=1 Tax=Trichocoleus TaxID=450526 RepID=UPI001688DE30|nr:MULTISPECIES: tetratricopeptide repeat protein [unclassified Trichocoleus]MBD2096503.1 tetratricopeptide repeat protein [Trichocoleus sp. FACHB-591]MBD2123998.1 tetratricopeptide repeat protein [Trichocoleus sp. FACHB-262]
MDNRSIERLLEDLKHADPEVRNRATQELWRRWFEQKGVAGLEQIRQAQMLLETGEKLKAEAVLTQLIQDLPDFAEAWNRRAVLYYVQGKYRKSLADCQQVVQLDPIHFGALHGIGLCHVALGEYREAIPAFRRALEIQPYSVENQRLILECSAKLS